MAIFEFRSEQIVELPAASFAAAGVRERYDLQRLLRENIEVIASGSLVIAEEFGDWDDSSRRIDLLAIDKSANLVVIELKRTDDGGHMDLQAVRYAAMVSTLDFDQAVQFYSQYLTRLGTDASQARSRILSFLGWVDQTDGVFARDVRIVLAAAEFSKEITTTVLWLNGRGIDVRCVRLKPYFLQDRLLVDVQQIIPTPGTADYQIKILEKSRQEGQSRASNADFTRFDLSIQGETFISEWKRNAVYKVCKRICDSGVPPEKITALFEWRSNRVWYSVPGELDAKEFCEAASAMAEGGGPSFDARRWFCSDEELVRSGGKTFAFSSQWGGAGWHRAMELLKLNFPEFKIDFKPTGSD